MRGADQPSSQEVCLNLFFTHVSAGTVLGIAGGSICDDTLSFVNATVLHIDGESFELVHSTFPSALTMLLSSPLDLLQEVRILVVIFVD